MSSPSIEPGWVWRQWWIWTEPSRLMVRLFSEQVLKRRIWIRLFLSACRLAGHVLLGNPWWFAGCLFLAIFTSVPVLVVVGVLVAFEIGLLFARWRRGRPLGIATYRLGIKFHRVWARVYADTAGKSEFIQDREGGSTGESRAPVVRSVVDHPRLPWRFWVRWPVITFRVGVAPGRSFAQFEQIMAQMSAGIPWVHAVELEYRTDRSSFGLLHVSLEDALAVPQLPTWLTKKDNSDSGDAERFAA